MSNNMSNTVKAKNRDVFTTRLPDELASKLRHYMNDREVTASKAIITILTKFFYNT